MRSLPLLVAAALLVAPLVPSVDAQASRTAELDLHLVLDPEEGRIEVHLEVQDPGNLREIRLGLGDLQTLVRGSEPQLIGQAWEWQGDDAVADLTADRGPEARWFVEGRILVNSTEGRGHTSYVGPEFAVTKVSDLMPSFRYSFPKGDQPLFRTQLTLATPDGWDVEGPWTTQGDGFVLDTVIPRGFVAAGPDLERTRLGTDGHAYTVIRVEGASEQEGTRDLLAASESFLSGIYGTLPINRFIVVAPDPMFQGGLASPEGIFLHAKADTEVVAHELVHAYQGFQVSRTPGEAAVWLAEGSAVAHGAQLEAAAGLTTKHEVQERLEERAERAARRHPVDLTNAVYGSDNELAAYTKGAIVVIGLNDRIRASTNSAYTLADVLSFLSKEYQQGRQDASQVSLDCLLEDPRAKVPVLATLTTSCLAEAIVHVTDRDPAPYFDEFVTGQPVPELATVFPGQAAIRILGTQPDPAVAMEPVTVRVALTNLDVTTVGVDEPVLIDGSEVTRLTATLGPGQRAETSVTLSPLAIGTYTLRIDQISRELTVVEPANLNASLDIWPNPPTSDQPITLGVIIENLGQAPGNGTVALSIDGTRISSELLFLPGGQRQTLTATAPNLTAGVHTVEAIGPDGQLLATAQVTVIEPTPIRSAPGPGVAVLLLGLIALAGLARARRRW